MHSVELLEEAIVLAQRLGYRIRQEWVGTGGGTCEFAGQRWLFIDLSQSVLEQLESVREALSRSAEWQHQPVSPRLARLLTAKRAA